MSVPANPGEKGLSEKVTIAADGSMVLPETMREALGIKGETVLVLTVEDGQILISTLASNIRKAQELFRKAVKRPFTSDDFLATRERD
jgi:AbrB family looped-hinge helix DNA binding protein